MHVKQHASDGFGFDSSSLLNTVTKYRSNTKGREAVVDDLMSQLHAHYDTVDAEYRPTDFTTPLHVYWTKIAKAVRPTIKRNPPPRRNKKNSIRRKVVINDAAQMCQFADASTQTEDLGAMADAEAAILERHTHIRGGKLALSERDGYWLRSMQVDGDVSDTKLNLNLGVAYMYFTGRIIPKPLMWGKGTVLAVNNRLQWYETERRKNRMQDMVHRYPRTNIYCYSDDSRKWHGVGPSFAYIDEITGERSIERAITTMSKYIKKKDKHHAIMGKQVMVHAGVPIHRIRGGGSDHPAESEIRELVRICCGDEDLGQLLIAIYLACGCHKTNLLMVWMQKIICPGAERGVFSHKQTAFVLRYAATHMLAYAAFVEAFMGCKGWWCNVPKMQMDTR
jgi:hypothetical protein